MRHMVGTKRREPACQLGVSDRDSVVGAEECLLGKCHPLRDELIRRQRRDGWLHGGCGSRGRRRRCRRRSRLW